MTQTVGILVGGVQKGAVEAVSRAIQLILEAPHAENKTKIAALKTLQLLVKIPDNLNTSVSGCSFDITPSPAATPLDFGADI